jgi:hypothetical protein
MNSFVDLVLDLRLMVIEYLGIGELGMLSSTQRAMQETVISNDLLWQMPLMNSKYRNLFSDEPAAAEKCKWRVLTQELFSRRCACCGNPFDLHPYELSFETDLQRDQFLQLSSHFSDPVASDPSLKRMMRLSRRLPGQSMIHRPIRRTDGGKCIKTAWMLGAVCVEMTADISAEMKEIKSAAYYFRTPVPVPVREGEPWQLLLALLPGDTYLLKYSRGREELQMGFWYQLQEEEGQGQSPHGRSIVDTYPPSTAGKSKRNMREEAMHELSLYLRSAPSFRATALERYETLLEKALSRRQARSRGESVEDAQKANEWLEAMVAHKQSAIGDHYEGFFRSLTGLASSFALVAPVPIGGV